MVRERRMNNCRVFTSGVDDRRERQSPLAMSPRSHSSERGSVTVMTAVLLVGLVLVIGLAIDVSRIYMLRAGLQNAADAAALAAARELDSGSLGLTEADAQARAAIGNQYGLSRTGAATPSASITTVEFASSLNGTWYAIVSDATPFASTIRFVRVTTQPASITMLFAAKALGSTSSVQASATAGMSPGLNTVCDYVPLAVAKTDPTTGFATGTELTLQLVDALSTNLVNQNMIVLKTSNSNSANLTRDAVAGLFPFCATIGTTVPTSNSQSAEGNNGPYQVQDGLNTRLDSYPPGNILTPSQAHPDTNVYQDPLFANFNWANYKAGSPLLAPTHPGLDNRRIIVMPIVYTGAISGSVRIGGFGAFMLLRSVVNPNQPSQCNNIPNPCGHVQVQYIGEGFNIGRGGYDPNGTCTTLTEAVLYK
jgi:Flp pilus assembly protein TadG